jgi:UDP-N-acetylglucosamine diphosphorylase / glucose-1-phosphate thymidylyltransferase / UDP-N-acetylgalactosamine diphosphorylase / glucosamine-1-phosphate N-acetyltransferase / galactosamine-1-phosphate N-acetyltransferase
LRPAIVHIAVCILCYSLMQAVILAAGRGVRLRPLTYDLPKPMIRLAGKNLIEHNLDRLPAEVDELVMVVGYLAPQIINHFGNDYQGRKITYVKQRSLLGTGHALKLCRDILAGRFLVMMGDDIYSSDDIATCLSHEQCLLARDVSGKAAGGRIKLNSAGHLEDIVEGIHNRKQSLINTGLYVLTRRFFDYNLVPLSGKKEYGLPQTIVKLAQDHPVKIVKAGLWLKINDLASLKRAENILKKELKD